MVTWTIANARLSASAALQGSPESCHLEVEPKEADSLIRCRPLIGIVSAVCFLNEYLTELLVFAFLSRLIPGWLWISVVLRITGVVYYLSERLHCWPEGVGRVGCDVGRIVLRGSKSSL